MRVIRHGVAAALLAALAGGCVTFTAGADDVLLTKNQRQLQSCKAVGDVVITPPADGVRDGGSLPRQFRDEVVHLGGNAAFVTFGSLDAPSEGTAYYCAENR